MILDNGETITSDGDILDLNVDVDGTTSFFITNPSAQTVQIDVTSTILGGGGGGGSAACFDGNGIESDPYMVTDCDCLQAIGTTGTTLDDYFLLDGNIDCSATVSWNGAQGFAPLGTQFAGFAGTLDGNGHQITDLTVNRPTKDRTGIFARTETGAVLKDIKLVDPTITGQHYAAALVGDSNGDIERVSITGGTINASGNVVVGMMAGSQRGDTSDSYVTGTVAGAGWTGGMFGSNFGIMNRTYAAVNVTGTNQTGGLVGDTNDSINYSFSTGNVSGSGSGNTGALIGWTNTGSYTNTGNTFHNHGGNPAAGVGTTNSITAIPTPQTLASYFYDSANFSTWDATTVWLFSGSAFPTLR